MQSPDVALRCPPQAPPIPVFLCASADPAGPIHWDPEPRIDSIQVSKLMLPDHVVLRNVNLGQVNTISEEKEKLIRDNGLNIPASECQLVFKANGRTSVEMDDNAHIMTYKDQLTSSGTYVKLRQRRTFAAPWGPCFALQNVEIRFFDNDIYMRDAARTQPCSNEDKNRPLFNLLGLEGGRVCIPQPGRHRRTNRDPHKPSTLQGNTKQPGTLICTNCGRRGHRAKDTICPALNQTCSLCGKLGHFKRVCRSGPATKPAPKQRDKRTRALQTKVNAVSSRPFLHTVHLLSGKHFIPITAEVDTGAQISGVTEATYRRHFAHLPLLPAATLRNFDNTVLSGRSLGRFLTQVKDKNRRVFADSYVPPPRCSAVIGQNLISALGLQIDASTMEIRAVTHDSMDIARDHPCPLSHELGTFPDYQHAIANSVRSFIFDLNAPTFVTTDASDVGLGAVLSQTQQVREVPIAHISHTLQLRERSYAVNEKEALACVWACETWEKYFLGRHFTLRTDHSSLASLLRSTTDSRKSAKFTRWLDRLSPFGYTIEYRQGKDNLVADALSRLSMRSAQSALHDSTHDHVVGALQTDHLSLLDVKSATKRDSTLSTVLHFLSSGWPSKKTLASLRNHRAPALTPHDRSPGEVIFHRSLRLPFQIPASAHRARPPSPQLATSASDAQGVYSRGPYRVGDRVLARRPQVLKGQSPWSKPLTVLKVLGNWTY
ncbi:integrase core domain protein [Plakobranchus ocellatus]|uniref:Integrase core domain protein n=1 Tax=Plakobranchus ocellatus TaxID=259542 RepID=A0AAV4AYH0_9GAST|nr:integrase core domain protein [Plakobranchus ocellatus]